MGITGSAACSEMNDLQLVFVNQVSVIGRVAMAVHPTAGLSVEK
jgi:hypothetical protein